MKRWMGAGIVTLTALVTGGWFGFSRTARADNGYDVSVAAPAYRGVGPAVLFDEAHNNSHRADARFKPFARLMRNDGYVIRTNEQPFTAESLAGHDVLVIVGAKGVERKYDTAFTAAEIDAVADWVSRGGALLLLTDHFPFGPASEKLASRFGVWMNGGEVLDEVEHDPSTDSSNLLFSKQLIADHPITRGRSTGEVVQRVMTFTGQSLKGGSAILRLAPSARELNLLEAKTEKGLFGTNMSATLSDPMPAHGDSQLVALEFGRGRVVVSGESAMLTAQIDTKGHRFGMNVAGIDNRQLALNIMHWLTRLI